MLNSEQKARLEVLLAMDALKNDEADELKELQALEPDNPAQDEFDAEWDELDGDKTPALKKDADEEKTLEQIQKDQEAQLEKDEKESQSTENVDGDLLNPAPVKSEKEPDSKDEGLITDPRDTEIAALKTEQEAQAQKMRSWEGRLKAADKRAVEAEQKLKDAKTTGQSKDSDKNASLEEDDAELGKFFKEYPDLEGPMKKVAEKLATKIFNEKIGDKIETLETNQATAQETAQEDLDRVHMEKINAAHPDWEKIFDSGALKTWIGRQPGYLQPRLTEIIKKGSAQEVIDMFDSYKRASGKSNESTSTNSTEADLKKQEKAKEIEAVPAASAGAKKGKTKITKDDFDGAWDDLEKKDKAKEK
jgi:hypothetical protein